MAFTFQFKMWPQTICIIIYSCLLNLIFFISIPSIGRNLFLPGTFRVSIHYATYVAIIHVDLFYFAGIRTSSFSMLRNIWLISFIQWNPSPNHLTRWGEYKQSLSRNSQRTQLLPSSSNEVDQSSWSVTHCFHCFSIAAPNIPLTVAHCFSICITFVFTISGTLYLELSRCKRQYIVYGKPRITYKKRFLQFHCISIIKCYQTTVSYKISVPKYSERVSRQTVEGIFFSDNFHSFQQVGNIAHHFSAGLYANQWRSLSLQYKISWHVEFRLYLSFTWQ